VDSVRVGDNAGMDCLPLDELLGSWLLALRGERRSPNTQRAYEDGVRSFLAYCADQDLPAELTKDTVRGYMASLDTAAPATASLRLTTIKQFAKWLAREEGFDADPLLTLRGPRLDERAVPSLSDDEIGRLIKACNGNTLQDRRDKAMVVLFAETGLRAAELLNLDVADVDLAGCVLLVRRGKGGKGRKVSFSVSCATVLDRYLRARRHEPGPLWTGRRGALTYEGMVASLKARAKTAGVDGFHVHRLRHSSAVRWLAAGGSETGLMAQSGWRSRQMIDRYIKTASEELAAKEFGRLDLGLGDL
jgi:integrase/recombinase XerD